jgi:hypothetical protein
LLRDLFGNGALERRPTSDPASDDSAHAQIGGGNTELAQRIAKLIVTKTGPLPEPVDPLLLALRSASNDRAASIIRESIERHFERPLRTRFEGARIAERAALLLAVLAGFQLLRRIIRTDALANGDSAFLEAQLTQFFQLLISGQALAASD